MNKTVVYKLTNIISERIYIGVTVNFERRMREHGHIPCLNKKIQKDLDDFDINFRDHFSKEIIFEGTEEECYEKEISLIAELKPFYNTSAGGAIGNPLSSSGENHGGAKFTNVEAKEIRELHSEGKTRKELANMFDVCGATIDEIVTGGTYVLAGGFTIEKTDRKGENNWLSKLTNEQAKEIRLLHSQGKTRKDLEKSFGVCNKTIADIITGDTYGLAGGNIIERTDGKGENSWKAKFTNSEAKDIRILHSEGKTRKELANMFDVCYNTIGYIVTGEGYRLAGGPIVAKTGRNGENNGQAKITAKDVLAIRIRASKTKDSARIIAEDYPIGGSQINSIINGKSRDTDPGPIKGTHYQKRGELAGKPENWNQERGEFI